MAVTVTLTEAQVTALLHAAQPDDFPTPAGAAGKGIGRATASAVEVLGDALRRAETIKATSKPGWQLRRNSNTPGFGRFTGLAANTLGEK